LIALYITAVIYLYMESFQSWMRGHKPGQTMQLGEAQAETVLR